MEFELIQYQLAGPVLDNLFCYLSLSEFFSLLRVNKYLYSYIGEYVNIYLDKNDIDLYKSSYYNIFLSTQIWIDQRNFKKLYKFERSFVYKHLTWQIVGYLPYNPVSKYRMALEIEEYIYSFDYIIEVIAFDVNNFCCRTHRSVGKGNFRFYYDVKTLLYGSEHSESIMDLVLKIRDSVILLSQLVQDYRKFYWGDQKRSD